MASYGHFRELNKLENINIETMEIKFDVINSKKRILSGLKNKISLASEVILATDNDREGEAIAWHICDYFKLSILKTKRILFQEISRTAILNALKESTFINMELVRAQQTRQILDLLVGFQISPLLWESLSYKHEKKLSAGRCQTPTLRLIFDNYLENENKNSNIVYHIKGSFGSKSSVFTLDKIWNLEYLNKIEIFYKNCANSQFKIIKNKAKILLQCPPQPLITSTLQQISSNELHYSPKTTMKCAQELYENGHITYMRTDKMKYSKEFISKIKVFIENKFGKEYLGLGMDELSINLKKKEEAHEAIRPIDIDNDLSENNEISNDAKKIYKIIKQRTIESCMGKSKIEYLNLEIPTEEEFVFKLRVEKNIFLGWRIVKTSPEENSQEIYDFYNSINNNSIIHLNELFSEIHLNEGSQHFTEAQLVKQLEKKGIGRPSTYSSLIDKIQERGYVEKKNILGKQFEFTNIKLINNDIIKKIEIKELGNEKNKLVITLIGKLVIEFLINNYNELFYYDFTKEMENKLDLITKGQISNIDVCKDLNKCILELIGNSNYNYKKEKMKIDEEHEIILGKYGHVIKKTLDRKISFIEIPKQIEIDNILNGTISINQLNTTKVEEFSIDTKYGIISIKKGRFGYYGIYKNEKISLKEWNEKTIHGISNEYIEKIIQENNNKIKNRILTNELSIRESKHGKYIYYKTDNMKKPQFLKLNKFSGDIENVSNEELVNWIQKTYNLKL
jgi:DNA topoisomerase-1